MGVGLGWVWMDESEEVDFWGWPAEGRGQRARPAAAKRRVWGRAGRPTRVIACKGASEKSHRTAQPSGMTGVAGFFAKSYPPKVPSLPALPSPYVLAALVSRFAFLFPSLLVCVCLSTKCMFFFISFSLSQLLVRRRV